MVVLVSITLTALLVMIYPNRFAQRLYALTLNKPLPVPGSQTRNM
jgi:hypothetical protein